MEQRFIQTKLTEAEYKRVQIAISASGRLIGEWMRAAVLDAANRELAAVGIVIGSELPGTGERTRRSRSRAVPAAR